MMDDGCRNKTTRFWRESSDSDFENSASSVEHSPFRGFEKEPRVLIEKFDIKAFDKPSLKTRKFRRKPRNGTCETLPQLVSSCFVKLAREDLQQLKKDFLENSRLKKAKPKGILIMPLLHCKICEKAYSSERKLQNHIENKHMLVYKAGYTRKPHKHKRVSFSDNIIVHEVKEYHRCRKCTKIFEEYKSLRTHMKQEHRKRKCYICNYCSKNFVDRMFFKVHIKHHCDVCGVLLPNKRQYLMHRRDSCRVVKKYTCRTCENKFFSYMDLKDHSYDHLEDLFVCDICKAQHSSKCAVSHHILFLHSEKRPKELFISRNLGNERLYLCNFCDVSSLDKDVIDKHMSVLPDLNNRKCTGYKDYYFCDQCLRKFDTETSMVQHKWSHFLNAYDDSQVVNEKVKKRPAKSGRVFKINEELPNLMQPKIVLERIDYVKHQDALEVVNGDNINSDKQIEVQREKNVEKETNDPKCIKEVNLIANNGISNTNTQHDFGPTKAKSIDATQDHVAPTGIDVDEISVVFKKAIVDPKSKKTLISKFQCQKCHKYYSSNYCLNRHILSMHQTIADLQCNVCEEIFVWPSLLKSHKCLRTNIPEMPFEDARPEIQFDNYRDFEQPGIDDLMNISANDDYMSAVDFEIPAPVVQLTEYENRVHSNGSRPNQQLTGNYSIPLHNSYKIVMQEVPIEF